MSNNNEKGIFKIKLNLDADFIRAINKLKRKYPEDFQRINGVHNDNLNFTDFIDAFANADTVADATIDPNANCNVKDVSSLKTDMCKPHSKLLSLHKIYYDMKKRFTKEMADTWLEREYNGGYYLHNATDGSFKPYCYAYDLDHVAEKGLFFRDGMKSTPAQHLSTFNNHILQFVSYASKLQTGAVGIPSYLVYSFYFWKKDVESGYIANPEKDRDQNFQSFIYNMNQTLLRVNQSAFTNLSIFDREYYTELFGGRRFPDGTPMINYVEEFMEYQKAFMRVVSKVRSEQMFTYPVLTYALLYKKGEGFVDKEFARWCSDHNCDWYDANFYNGADVSVLSNCCRLLSDMSELDAFINSIGGTSLQIGSAVVNTINLRRLALLAKGDEDCFLDMLDDYTFVSMCAMDSVRNILMRNVEKGFLPNYKHEIIKFENQFNTIGITSFYECIREFGYIEEDEFGNQYYSDEGMAFAHKIFELLNNMRKGFNVNYPFNIESVPAETANVVLCKKDTLLFGNEFDDFIYRNQWIGLDQKCTISEKLRLSAELDPLCGGGAIAHINLEAPFNNPDQAWDMLNHIAETGVIYFAFNVKTSVCASGHAFFGETCPTCGGAVADYYTRVVGFLTPVSSYAKERKKEYNDRIWFPMD